MSSRRLIISSLIVVGCILYAFNLGDKLFWDDADWIVNNPVAHAMSWHNISFVFTHDILAGIGLQSNYYRPVLMLSFMANWAVGGDSPYGYHLVSNAIHIANAVLIFLLLEALLKKRRVAAVAAVLWLIHPLQTEAVAYVSGRGDPLSVFFMLSALYLWLTRHSWRSKALALTCGVAAVLSRETGALLPLYLTVSLMAFVYTEGFWRSLWHSLRASWPFYTISAAYGLARLTVLNFHNTLNWYAQATDYTEHVAYRVWTFLQVLGVYARIIVLPTGLHMERSVPVLTSPLQWPVPLVVAALALLVWQIVRTWRAGNRLWFWAAMMFFIPLGPSSGIIPINALIYEHWLYLSLLGFVVLVAVYGDRLHEWLRARSRTAGIIMIFLVVTYGIFLGIQTVRRNIIWGQPERLYLQILSYVPDNVRVLNNLANLYADQKDAARTEEYLKKAIAADPAQPAPYYNLGNLYRDQKKYNEALELYRTSIRVGPQFHYGYRNLAVLLMLLRRYSDALDTLVALQQLTPDDVKVYYNIVTVAVLTGKTDIARQAAQAGRALSDPGTDVWKQFDTYLNSQ